MAKTITPINTATDTFNTWVTQTNTIIDTIATEVMTANVNANGAFVTGNSQLFGIFTANVVAVYNELRGGNVQATGALLITSDATVNTGNFTMGVDDSVPGLLTIYGGGTGELSGLIRTYNNADDDTNAVYWQFGGEDGTGDFLIEDDAGTDALRIDDATLAVTIAQGLTVTTGGATITAGGLDVDAGLTTLDGGLVETSGSANIGVNDTTAGLISIFGDATAGGRVFFYNGADDDTGFEYWNVGSSSADGDFIINRSSIDIPLTIDNGTGLTTLANGLTVTTGLTTLGGGLIETSGLANVGVNDTTPGILRLFGGTTAETAGELYIYNPSDHDTNADYWRLTGEDGTGDFVLGDPGKTDVLRIDETTFLTTLANGLTVTTGITTLAANLDLSGTARIILDADNDSDIYASADDNVILRVGAATRLNVNTTYADFQTTALRTGGDIWIDTDTGDFRAGAGTSNLVANSSTIRLANSTVTLDITKPTAAQVSAGTYYLNADGTWALVENQTVVDTTTSGTAAQVIDSFLKSSFRSAEYTLTISDTGANNRITNAYITEYGTVTTNTAMGSLSANCNTTHCILYLTPAQAATTVKGPVHYIDV
jgi:hypothetical protein